MSKLDKSYCTGSLCLMIVHLAMVKVTMDTPRPGSEILTVAPSQSWDYILGTWQQAFSIIC